MRALLAPLAVACAALVPAWTLDLGLAETTLARPYDVLHIPSSTALRVASLGHAHLASTLYWLSAVQYLGDPKADARGYDKLYPLVDLVTDLDPRHGYAYQTAGIVLSAANRIDESNRILQKGMEKGPPWWSFPYYISFNHWFYRGDYATGAEYARIAATRPGASTNIAQLAVSLSAKSGTPEDAIKVLEDLKANVTDEVSAARLDEQLKLAVLERDAQQLERAAARFRAERGRWPADPEELLRERYIPSIPRDPFGGQYVRDADWRVHSTANAFRFQLVDGPHQPRFEFKATEENLRRFTR